MESGKQNRFTLIFRGRMDKGYYINRFTNLNFANQTY